MPELAHKYPEKRAKGWIKSATIGPDFLELRVEWLEDNATDGFGWFSPYWGGPAEHLANGRYLKTVNDLTSVALVNIPNIQDFRLANESQGGEQTKGKAFAMPQHLIDLARRFDERVRLANEANFDESKHPRSADGKFSSGGGGSAGGGPKKKPMERSDSRRNPDFVESLRAKELASDLKGKHGSNRSAISGEINKLLKYDREDVRSKDEGIAATAYNGRRESHRAAIILGLKYNRSTHQYE